MSKSDNGGCWDCDGNPYERSCWDDDEDEDDNELDDELVNRFSMQKLDFLLLLRTLVLLDDKGVDTWPESLLLNIVEDDVELVLLSIWIYQI